MPATAPAGAQSWVAGTRMQLTQAGPRSGSSPGHGLLPPSRTQVTRRHAGRGPPEVGQGAQLSAAGQDGCKEAVVVEVFACRLGQAHEAVVRVWKLESCSQLIPQRVYICRLPL